MNCPFSLLNWNARGLNDKSRRGGVRSLVSQSRCALLCVQETKKAAFSPPELCETAGPELTEHVALPTDGTRGGVLLAWNPLVFRLDGIVVSEFAIIACVAPLDGGQPWWLTTVYGPTCDTAKLRFLAELAGLRTVAQGPWLIISDFNLIYEARDKSSPNLNRRLMARFRDVLNASELRELKLAGRRFTWSNEQASPVLVWLDRAFCDNDWVLAFRGARLQPLATAMSDHCPLLLTCEPPVRRPPCFRFEAFWPHTWVPGGGCRSME